MKRATGPQHKLRLLVSSIFFIQFLHVPASNAAARIALLVPSTGHWHLQKHDEAHDYFQAMDAAFDKVDVRLELFKDWYSPPVMKDYVHFRLDSACNSGVIKDQVIIDRVRKAKMLLHAAVPDQVKSGIEAGWRADHRILAAQALAFKVIEYRKDGLEVDLIGLGVGGGQIVAGASRLLAGAGFDLPTKSLAGVIGELANALDATAPFFGPYAVFIAWGARATHFASRAAQILKNDKYLWQAAQLPVTLYQECCFAGKKMPEFLINKLFTVATPVGKEHFAPNVDSVRLFYNLYAPADLKCRFLGHKAGIKGRRSADIVNLAINFDYNILPAGHLKMMNSTTLASWIPSIHENIQNPEAFKFGVPGELTIYKKAAPIYAEGKAEKRSN